MARRNLAGKRVLLTGASSGIGWYIATELIAAGAAVVVSGRRQDRLEQLRLSLGNPRQLIAVAGDICDAAHRQQLIQAAAQRLGGIDLLINNAGVGAIGNFDETTPERIRQIFEVDFFAAVELTRLAIPYLKRGRESAICNVNSVLGYRGVPGKSEYCAAKFALRGWSEALRIELRPHGIDVVSVSPSTTRSEFFQALIEGRSQTAMRSLGSQSAHQVARRVVGALRGRKRDLILSPAGKALVWLSHLAPRLTDQLLLRYAMP